MRKADDEYRDAMAEALEELDCLRQRLIAVLKGVDHFEEGLDKVEFEMEDTPKKRK